MADEVFKNAGQQVGLDVWRIENFKLTKINQQKYGTFHTGDSYLVLKTISVDNQNLKWNIHFWLGSESTLDEMATAAIKAVELDDHLGGSPVQYREVQNHESKLFKSYFENGIRYLTGGVKSGFNSIDNIEQVKRLYLVKGKKDVRVIEVPLAGSSLNKSDVFILEDGLNIYQWNPPNSSRMERMKANNYAKQIRDNEHAGKASIHLLEDDWDTNEKFWAYFDCTVNDIKEDSDVEDKEFEGTFKNENVSLYRISDLKSSHPSIEQTAKGPLEKSMLDSNDCFIVDCGLNGIYTWIGKKCTKNEKISSIMATKELMVKNNYPNYIPMAQLIDGAETTSFKSIFSDWH